MSLAIGIDLGGTNLRVALVDAAGNVQSELREKTPVVEGPQKTAEVMSQLSLALQKSVSEKILGIGIGSPGPLSREKRTIFQTPNLPGFDGFPLGTVVEKLSGLPTFLDNDAKCATLGEGKFGNARGAKNFLLLTFGTGIGGGIVVDGQMLYGKSDGACEIGHMTLHPGGRLCKCGNLGCFEQYVSATALERRVEENFQRKISNVALLDSAQNKEDWALQVLEEFTEDLAIGCASLVNIFDPEKIIFGGGLFTTGGGPLCALVQEKIKDRCFKSSQRGLEILPSGLRGEAGVLGAASLVFG